MEVKKIFFLVFDLTYAAVSVVMALVAYIQTRFGPERLPLSYRVWDHFRVTPVRHHYYQPVYDVHCLPAHLWTDKYPLHGVNFNADDQFALLEQFKYQDELSVIPVDIPAKPLGFYHRNHSFEAADAEMLYNMVRFFKPRRVIEIGAGYSTRIMKYSLDVNRVKGYASIHRCIEPYDVPWIEQLGIDEVIRLRVEDVERILFDELEANDILFIDSSHVLRTGGDVFVEYLQILPILKPGVLVHIHDIFIPYEYPKDWIVNKRRFWTEQYIVQAFLSFNQEFEILSAVHWLAMEHPERLARACPVYGKLGGVPGSFWVRKI